MMHNKIKTFAMLGLAAAPVIWGFAFVVVKNSLDSVSALYMMVFRFTIAFVALSCIYFKKYRMVNAAYLKNGAILGIFLYLSYLLQTIGCKYTTAGKNAFLTTIYVVIVPFIHWAVSKKRPTAYSVVAAVMAIFGIGLLSLNGDFSVNIGDVLTLGCGITYAVHIIFIDDFNSRQDPILLTILQLGFTAALSWITAPIFDGGFPTSAFSSDFVKSMLYLGIMSTMVAYLFQTVGQKYTAPATAALLLSLESVFGMLFSVIFLHEMLTVRSVIGCIIIFAAITVSETLPSVIAKSNLNQTSDA